MYFSFRPILTELGRFKVSLTDLNINPETISPNSTMSRRGTLALQAFKVFNIYLEIVPLELMLSHRGNVHFTSIKLIFTPKQLRMSRCCLIAVTLNL